MARLNGSESPRHSSNGARHVEWVAFPVGGSVSTAPDESWREKTAEVHTAVEL